MAVVHKQVFNDSVHGHIELHPLLVKIVDTPEFQRLRNIKQLGAGYYVFPGASHNRFEHSIGVAHLAGKLVQRLRSCQEELRIDDKDELCVQIAGLCHDLGHGPFSHVFERLMKKLPYQWQHEGASVRMFYHLITRHGIRAEMENKYKFENQDFKFIRELINPPAPKDRAGRPDKLFLYEIVANKTTGIDVAKMDCFARDCHHLGMKCSFSHERYLMFVRVCDGHLCMRDKEARNMFNLFHTRNYLYNNIYHHPVKKAIELMIVDALFSCYEEQPDINRLHINFIEAVNNMEFYTKLTDDTFQPPLPTTSNENFQRIIERIHNRELYRCIGEKVFPSKEDAENNSQQVLKTSVDVNEQQSSMISTN
ncbi:deoxynucleoside triphosphate triphosphohydrolase SAMHD1-like isoform X2 [Brachyhypopomus gauderio]|uniref:deoxynucleoside triphosphate triphosphohydrolase SAMHD1-like isoform X2 n=1 Tax=Brachyhypopomus gauderio TaxID=698409 RepID=UPI0040433969